MKLGMGKQCPVDSHRSDSDGLQQAIQRGEFVLVYHQGCIVGACALTWDPEPCLSQQPEKRAGYVGKLTVSEQMSGRGVGSALLKWLEAEVARSGGTHLRLDCWSGNERLIRYYTDVGFEHRANAPEDDHQVALFEKLVAPSSDRARSM